MKNGSTIGTMDFTFSRNDKNFKDGKQFDMTNGYRAGEWLEMNAISSNGESFSGAISRKYVPMTGFGGFINDYDMWWQNMLGMKSVAIDDPTQFWHGDLVGSKGTSMSCDFDSFSKDGNVVNGSEGKCSLSDGSNVAVNVMSAPVFQGKP